MTSEALFELITSALSPLELDLNSDRDKRVYLAYIAARAGLGHDGTLEGRLNRLRKEMKL